MGGAGGTEKGEDDINTVFMHEILKKNKNKKRPVFRKTRY